MAKLLGMDLPSDLVVRPASPECESKNESASSATSPDSPSAKPANQKNIVVRVGRETKGRRGKGVTIIYDLPLNESGLSELAATLKQRCGTGGTVKEGRVEIQGDQRDRLVVELEKLGYRVKKAGG